MEGIAGTFGMKDKHLVRRMLEKLEHRGPDTSEVYADDGLILGARMSRRNTIEKTSAIAQEEGVAVACDSYIFNKELLRRTIAPSCDENVSDAQLVLNMYRTIGTPVFRYIDGAYAIVIVDHGKTIVARDAYGLKPLYFSGDMRRGVYSSEIKSQQLAEEKFSPFQPGKMLVSGEGLRKIVRQEMPWIKDIKPKRSADRVRQLILQSVSACTDDSNRFNVLLSGGIDSSVIAAAAAQTSSSIQSVCVGTKDSEDIKMARLVADHLGTKHKERVYDVEDMLKVLNDAIYHGETFDYPLVRSCIPNYMATHVFSDRHNITLCGEGGDEIFAGYDFLLGIKEDETLRSERVALLRDGHMTGFQRVDRMTASASLDGRMPMMSSEVVDYGLQLDRKELLGSKIEKSKLVLRKAFADLLPKQVTWRRKRRFGEGAGSISSLVGYSEKLISDKEFERERKLLPRNRIRTKEELMYYRIFQRHFPSESALAAVGFTPRS
jgi:asparagine synthase (glutamine-hydrolysing)